jgi:hypothetical protein
MFIGDKVFTFRSMAEIIEYVSHVGNNDVPYPYAIDCQGRYYLMIEDVVLGNVPELYQDDPYCYYYLNNVIGIDMDYYPRRRIRNEFHDISKFFIGPRDRYNMCYRPNPDDDYDRFMSFEEVIRSRDRSVYIVKKGSTRKIRVKKDEYVNLINEYGEMMGFSKLTSLEDCDEIIEVIRRGVSS